MENKIELANSLQLASGFLFVIPTEVGIQSHGLVLDSCSPLKSCGDKLRRNDVGSAWIASRAMQVLH